MTYAQWYEHIARPFRDPKRRRSLKVLADLCTYGIAILYIAALAYLAATGDLRLWRALLVPAMVFVVGTILRMAVNRARPYEAHDIDPLLPKDTTGRSWPSRHALSAAILALTLLWIWIPVGILGIVLGIILVITRVLAGVHYPSDVIAAIILAGLGAILGYGPWWNI